MLVRVFSLLMFTVTPTLACGGGDDGGPGDESDAAMPEIDATPCDPAPPTAVGIPNQLR